jgi:two-component system cell cycle response regulator
MPPNWILLLDPFENLLNAYRIILEEEKYLVETALNLREAYQLLEKRQYAIIITEYIPPSETTDHMIQWMKNSAPEVYIIMVTNATVDEKTYEKLFTIGVDDFILKPYSPEKILVHIKKGLNQRNLILKLRELERRSLLEPIAEEIQGFIFNTAFFKQRLRQELKKAKRHQHSLSLLLIQIPPKEKLGDHFEILLKELAKILRRNLREEDIIGRENGNFGILLPETDQVGSKALVQRLSNLIQTHSPFISDDVLSSHIQTLSFQSFTFPDQFAIPESLKTILEEVDKEYLYH